MQQQARSTYFDIVKGVAITLMVLGHCIDQANGWAWVVSGESSRFWLWQLIASFHMPLFMAVSGFFYSRSLAKRGTWAVIRQRAQALLIPSTLWSGLFIALCYGVYYIVYGGNASPQMQAYLYHPVPVLWFLWALFFSCVVVAIVHRWAKDCVWVHVGICVGTLFLPNVLFSPEVFSVHPCFVLAYYIGKHREQVALWLQQRNRLLWVFIGSVLVYTLLYAGMDEQTTVYVSKFSLWGKLGVKEMLWRDVYRLALGLSGSIVVLILLFRVLSLLSQLRLTSLLAYCGQMSLGIYGLNNFLCMYPRLMLANVEPNAWCVGTVFVAMMGLSLAVVWVLNRWQCTAKWLLGKV